MLIIICSKYKIKIKTRRLLRMIQPTVSNLAYLLYMNSVQERQLATLSGTYVRDIAARFLLQLLILSHNCTSAVNSMPCQGISFLKKIELKELRERLNLEPVSSGRVHRVAAVWTLDLECYC